MFLSSNLDCDDLERSESNNQGEKDIDYTKDNQCSPCTNMESENDITGEDTNPMPTIKSALMTIGPQQEAAADELLKIVNISNQIEELSDLKIKDSLLAKLERLILDNRAKIRQLKAKSVSSNSSSESERKGRFLIENVSKERRDTHQTTAKGRFKVTGELPLSSVDKNKTQELDTVPANPPNTQPKQEVDMFKIVEIQGKQLDVLFDMIKNISNDDKLFHADYTKLSNEAYEQISVLKKKLKQQRE